MRLLRLAAVRDKLGGTSVSTFYRRYRRNSDFPPPVLLPSGQLAWREHEVDAFIARLPRVGKEHNV